ncbi:hypothetical protein [Priestia flexa]|uniref:hypothetical protein n=1 Tax=Priestia flexa TaxID=86664 RepID=UPI00249380D7|nr:hypothetical protein [Priestia flexa]
MPKKETLNGRWVHKENLDKTLFVERVYKAGYITGFGYLKTEKGEVISQQKLTHDELKRDYKKQEYN